jgi:hypothetical protein
LCWRRQSRIRRYLIPMIPAACQVVISLAQARKVLARTFIVRTSQVKPDRSRKLLDNNTRPA